MTITPEQLARRRNHIGSSDWAGIIGHDNFSSRHKVYLSKVQELDWEGNDATRRGDWLEKGILEATKYEFEHDTCVTDITVAADDGVHEANLDALMTGVVIDGVTYDKAVVEIKSTTAWEEWGEKGTDEIPHKVMWQVQQQMYCANVDIAIVTVLLPGLDFKHYVVKKDLGLIAFAVETCMDFWKNNVMTKTPPEGEPDAEYLKLMPRNEGTMVLVNDKLIKDVAAAKSALSTAEELVSQTQNKLIHAMKDGDGAQNPECEVQYTYREQRGRSSYGVSKDHTTDVCPECGVGKKVGKPFRVLRAGKYKGLLDVESTEKPE